MPAPPFRLPALLGCLLAHTGCDFSQREAPAPATTFAIAIQDGHQRRTAEVGGAEAEMALVAGPDGSAWLEFALRARSDTEAMERLGSVGGRVPLPNPVLATGRYSSERATVAFTERRDGTEYRYAFPSAQLELALEVVTETRLAGRYRATASGLNGRTEVVVTGIFGADR